MGIQNQHYFLKRNTLNGGSPENLRDFIHTALNYVQANADDILDLMEEEE